MVAAMQAALIARALGSDVEVPDLAEYRGRFDEQLTAVPDPVDDDRWVLLDALGLGRHV